MLAALPRAARTVDIAADRLRQGIVDEEFAAGEPLPPERSLAEQLGISRLTLRAALARLEAEGLVRARQGDGVRVLKLSEHATLGVLAHLNLDAQPKVARSFLELRRAIAAEAVALACERATDAQLQALEVLAAAQAVETDEARYVERDIAFARALLEAAESFAALLLFNALAPVYAAQPKLARALIADRERSLAGYQLTLALLRGRDGPAARQAVREGLEQLDAEVLARLAPRAFGTKPAPRDGAKRPRRGR